VWPDLLLVVFAMLPAGLVGEIRGTPGHSLSMEASEDDKRSCLDWAAAHDAALQAFFNATAADQRSCAATLGSQAYLQGAPFAGGH
jgi:hypothetical protein